MHSNGTDIVLNKKIRAIASVCALISVYFIIIALIVKLYLAGSVYASPMVYALVFLFFFVMMWVTKEGILLLISGGLFLGGVSSVVFGLCSKITDDVRIPFQLIVSFGVSVVSFILLAALAWLCGAVYDYHTKR